ncbi:hypothetical protein BH23VER1_BH23VER1_34770 [soil metagenome]
MGGMLATAAASAGIRPAWGDTLPDYSGPNVIIIRFGGGVRRRETIDAEHTYAPFLIKELAARGTLYPNMVIDQIEDINTSHGEGTLYILTGKYEKYQDVAGKFLAARFESKVPTLFEYLRKTYAVPEHQTLIVNGEDRTDEEFYSFSNHHLFGANFRSETLSLYRYKIFLLRRQIAEARWAGKELAAKMAELTKMESLDYRSQGGRQHPEVEAFWEKWRAFYGESGLVNPRGDRLLTELAQWSLKHLRPKLMMVNYNDPDYVHWGNMSFYTRGISAIDQGLRELVASVESDPEYRENTVFVIVPDCGRDTNPLAPVPCQHHFNSRSSREIWALLVGSGVAKGRVVDRQVDQTSIAKTVGQIMGAPAEFAEGPVLEEVFA